MSEPSDSVTANNHEGNVKMPSLVWAAVAANLVGALLIVGRTQMNVSAARTLPVLALLLFSAATCVLVVAAFQIEVGIGTVLLLAAAAMNAAVFFSSKESSGFW